MTRDMESGSVIWNQEGSKLNIGLFGDEEMIYMCAHVQF